MTEATAPGAALAGRRVVVTRAAEQAGPLADLLRAHGAEPMLVPLIQIEPPSDGGAALDAALARLAEFHWVVVTSPNGAERIRPALDRPSEASATSGSQAPRIAVVGTVTELAVGRTADLVPAEQTAAALGDAFPDGPGTVLIVEPERHDGALAATLEAKQWDVTRVPAYRTGPVRQSSATLLRVLAADAVLFASGSAIRAWVDVFGIETPAVTVAIGPSTAAVGGELGLKIDAVAADHSLHGLVSCLVAYFLESV